MSAGAGAGAGGAGGGGAAAGCSAAGEGVLTAGAGSFTSAGTVGSGWAAGAEASGCGSMTASSASCFCSEVLLSAGFLAALAPQPADTAAATKSTTIVQITPTVLLFKSLSSQIEPDLNHLMADCEEMLRASVRQVKVGVPARARPGPEVSLTTGRVEWRVRKTARRPEPVAHCLARAARRSRPAACSVSDSCLSPAVEARSRVEREGTGWSGR